MNETEIRALGFEPWYGGDEPSDYDHEKGFLFRNGDTASGPHWKWQHDAKASPSGTHHIIGYKKKETPMEYPEWVYTRAHTLAKDHNALCQHILDHEQPPVDPDVALAEKIYEKWDNAEITGVQNAILAAIKEARNA